MPFGASAQSIGIAAAMCAPIAVVVGAAINAGAFHRFQKLTPGTWRPEGPRKYAMGCAARALTGITYPLLFAFTGMPMMTGANSLEIGLKFGLLCWAALMLPATLSIATFVNLHRGFVLGMLLDWLLISLACGMVCVNFVQKG